MKVNGIEGMSVPGGGMTKYVGRLLPVWIHQEQQQLQQQETTNKNNNSTGNDHNSNYKNNNNDEADDNDHLQQPTAPGRVVSLTLTGVCGYLHLSSWLCLSVIIFKCRSTTSRGGGLCIFSRDQNS